MIERVRTALRLLRLQEPGSAPEIFREIGVSLPEEIFAYLAVLRLADPRAYRRISEEYSEVITSLRRGELERSPEGSSLGFFAHQLVSELQWAIVVSEREEEE